MAFSASTLASIVIGATAITGSAFAVNLTSSPSSTTPTNSVLQQQDISTPLVTPEPTSPSDVSPINPIPTPTPSQSPVTPPPAFNGDDDDNYEDEGEDDGDDWEDEDYDDDYDDEYEDSEDEEWED